MTTFESVITSEDGIIAWRRGTGGNVELTYILVKSEARRAGQGRSLFRAMLTALRSDPPYATVYGFTRTSNTAAREFYLSLGFTLSEVAGVYADGSAVVFSGRFLHLIEVNFPEHQ